jgi:endogenous inhibitor of DNA gyrase (YacG/DUF329 family)
MKTRTCPICRKAEPRAPYTPFCSKRCADVDLQRWFSGAYAVPAVDQDDPEEGIEPGLAEQ